MDVLDARLSAKRSSPRSSSSQSFNELETGRRWARKLRTKLLEGHTATLAVYSPPLLVDCALYGLPYCNCAEWINELACDG